MRRVHGLATSARRVLLGLLAVGLLVCCPTAAASLGDEQALANRYAPVVRLVQQKEECGPTVQE